MLKLGTIIDASHQHRLGVLRVVAGAMGQAGSNNLLGRGWPLLSLGPEHAATIARDGFTKQQVQKFLFENARFPLAASAPSTSGTRSSAGTWSTPPTP